MTLDTQKFPKPRRKRDPKYLAYVRRQGCLCCKNYAEAHHLEHGGVGTKGSDYVTAPLCWRHHRELHDIGHAAFEVKHGLDLYRIAAELLEKYFANPLEQE